MILSTNIRGVALAKQFYNSRTGFFNLIIEFMYATAHFRIIAILNRAFETESLGINSVSTISQPHDPICQPDIFPLDMPSRQELEESMEDNAYIPVSPLLLFLRLRSNVTRN